MKTQEIPYFGGVVTSLEKSLLKPSMASRALNARYEDGALRSRRGFKNLAGIQTNFASLHGLAYLQGYNSSNALTEEYVSFERLSSDAGGKGQPYKRDVGTGAPTVITNGGTPVAIDNSFDMVAFAWQDKSYHIHPGETSGPLWEHTLGTTNTYTQIKTAIDPPTNLTYTLTYGTGDATTYPQLSWAGLDPTTSGEMACTGAARNSFTQGATSYPSALTADNEIKVQHSTGVGSASFEVDMNDITAGVADWSYNDAFAFRIVEGSTSSTVWHLDATSIKVTFRNNDGSPVTLDCQTFGVRMGTNLVNVFVYPLNKNRALWDNVRYFKVEYTVISRHTSAAQNYLTMGKPYIGCCFPASPADNREPYDVFGYSYYSSTTTFESGVGGAIEIPRIPLYGFNPLPGGTGGGGLPIPGPPPDPPGGPGTGTGGGDSNGRLGVWIKFTMTDSADSTVDNYRLYWYDSFNSGWRRIVTQSDGTDTYTLKMTWPEHLALTFYEGASGGYAYANLVGGFPFKGWVIWLYKGGYQNVQHSRVGEPLKQYSDLDEDDDLNRGAIFSMADNFGDEPWGVGCQAGNSALIAGKDGIYEQVDSGGYPAAMLPPKKLPGSFGVASKDAFARWKDDFGNPGAVYVDRNGSGVYFALPTGVGDRDAEAKIVELTESIRGSLREFLMLEQGLTDFTTCRIMVDDAEDALFVMMGDRAMKFPRPNVASGKREWEFYEYNLGGTFRCVSHSSKRRMRFMRSTGQFDELEWNQAVGVPIEGYGRDGGSPMPPGYWESKGFDGRNRRILRLYLARQSGWKAATVRVISRRRTQKYQVAADKRWTRCLPDQQGEEHVFRVDLTEDDQVFTSLRWQESQVADRVLT